MAYGTTADVQALIPRQLLGAGGFGPASQPNQAQVTTWISTQSAWIDSTLRWKYSMPATDSADVAMLTTICAMLVAAQVWSVLGGHDAQVPGAGPQLVKMARMLLAYDERTGRSSLVLLNTSESDSGEATVGQPEASFTDPDSEDEDVNPRLFSIDQEF